MSLYAKGGFFFSFLQRSEAEKLCRVRLALARFGAYIKACSAFLHVQMRVHTLYVKEREREEKEPSYTGNRQKLIVKTMFHVQSDSSHFNIVKK